MRLLCFRYVASAIVSFNCVSERKLKYLLYPFLYLLKALATVEEKGNQETKNREDLEEAISWYNRVLGFRIEGGHDSYTISISAPVSSISAYSKSESLAKQSDIQAQSGEIDRPPKRINHGRAGRPAILSPGSASSLHWSPCFKSVFRRVSPLFLLVFFYSDSPILSTDGAFVNGDDTRLWWFSGFQGSSRKVTPGNRGSFGSKRQVIYGREIVLFRSLRSGRSGPPPPPQRNGQTSSRSQAPPPQLM
ncbi:hypothetical protein HHK36_032977 [Tetracentron sinense]|uniref:Uncharacterized protein n=1 Tax=Tetracentron sinense TaxID=13715 RepID=A0A834Y4M9_TETSI|nr:hypothetical protein HHK36_032977 [Tetracentron sinense]